MMKICYIVAMQQEAQPFIDHYGVEEVKDFFAPLPCKLYRKDDLYIVHNGKIHGSNIIGCEAAAMTTTLAMERLHPDIVVTSGTCGGFKSEGADIADVFIGNKAMFHDRRVPGDDEWGTQALGNYSVWEGSQKMAEALGLPMAKLTTGSSLDMQPCDLEIIKANGGQLKDMEGAAVAFTCSLYNVPIIIVKSVTDLCDSGAETFEEFSKNLEKACESLRQANVRVIDYLRNLKAE